MDAAFKKITLSSDYIFQGIEIYNDCSNYEKSKMYLYIRMHLENCILENFEILNTVAGI